MIWVLGTLGAFLLTAGAFLLLANLGTSTSERSLDPGSQPSDVSLPLQVKMDKGELRSLQTTRGQELTLVVLNDSSSSYSKVSLTLRVSSEDTSLAESRYYRAKVNNLRPGKSKPVRFPLDLLPLADARDAAKRSGNQARSRVVLEVQATTPEGISTVKTAVLPFSSDDAT
ncbi:hypothetical protein BH23ACT11_BH23ACT11_09280 [soil metagenome]